MLFDILSLHYSHPKADVNATTMCLQRIDMKNEPIETLTIHDFIAVFVATLGIF